MRAIAIKAVRISLLSSRCPVTSVACRFLSLLCDGKHLSKATWSQKESLRSCDLCSVAMEPLTLKLSYALLAERHCRNVAWLYLLSGRWHQVDGFSMYDWHVLPWLNAGLQSRLVINEWRQGSELFTPTHHSFISLRFLRSPSPLPPQLLITLPHVGGQGYQSGSRRPSNKIHHLLP